MLESIDGLIEYFLSRANGARSRNDSDSHAPVDPTASMLWRAMTAEQRATIADKNPYLSRQLDELSLSPAAADHAELELKWAGYFHDCESIEQLVQELRDGEDYVEGLFPRRSIINVCADSGTGKTPLIYQAAFCIATGMPFLAARA